MHHAKIVIADDHPLYRAALKQAVTKSMTRVEIVEVSTMAELQDAAQEHNDADLVLLDLTMPGASGFSGLVYLKGQVPELPVVVVSGNEDHAIIRRALEYGALGFIPKSVSLETMVEAVQAALAGDVWVPDDVNLEGPVLDDKEAKIAAGIASLWGPAHGGANEACLKMLEEIGSVDNIPEYVDRAKDKDDPFRLMGFGHRVYGAGGGTQII